MRTSTPKDLQNIQDREIHKGPLASVINRRALDHNSISYSEGVRNLIDKSRFAPSSPGKLTPQASVAVQTKTLVRFCSNMRSDMVRSDLSIPAWCILSSYSAHCGSLLQTSDLPETFVKKIFHLSVAG